MKPVLFVAFSHQLQLNQIAGLKAQYGIEAEDIILLSDVNPELAETCKQIDPLATLEQVKELAALVVVEACKAGATHFYCQGEPTLAMWANMYSCCNFASHKVLASYMAYGSNRLEGGNLFEFVHIEQMTCIVSTTERRSIDDIQPDGSVVKRAVFNHVTWRELF